jgi:hypothetical protein
MSNVQLLPPDCVEIHILWRAGIPLGLGVPQNLALCSLRTQIPIYKQRTSSFGVLLHTSSSGKVFPVDRAINPRKPVRFREPACQSTTPLPVANNLLSLSH